MPAGSHRPPEPATPTWAFALDQNFPTPILDSFSKHLPGIELVPVRSIDERLPGLGDRELLVALHQLGWQALITNNYRMLRNPRELAAILKTKITVVAIQGLGDDMVRASGALLLDLPGVCRRMSAGRDQTFVLRPRDPRPLDPWEQFETAARRAHRDRHDLYDEVKVTDQELSQPVLS